MQEEIACFLELLNVTKGSTIDFFTDGNLKSGVVSGIIATGLWSLLVLLYKKYSLPHLAYNKIIKKTIEKAEKDINDRVELLKTQCHEIAQAYFIQANSEALLKSDKDIFIKQSTWRKSEAARMLNEIEFDFNLIYSIEEVGKLFDECKHIIPDVRVRKIEQITLTNKYILEAFESYKRSLEDDDLLEFNSDILHVSNTLFGNLCRILFIIHQIKGNITWHHTGSVKIATETIRVKYNLPKENSTPGIAIHWLCNPPKKLS